MSSGKTETVSLSVKPPPPLSQYSCTVTKHEQ